ncbi:hypothetical protein [Streptomyces sp. N35]|uniref:hypothetical protein n=1 Tax=Streptomyces sp. N35 TaxID=2795730 RepID=UPI0018F522E1|nr:hypothetical protein [Streptomyces sp. N35]
MTWLIDAGLHPRAGAATLAVARDLAARMDFSTGHVRYQLEGMQSRLGMSRATVSRHVAYLRELGALVWVQHGSKANVRRALGLGGYAATATVYGAVIPAVYDEAMGHRIVGSGYAARIVIDLRERPVPVDNSPVDNRSSSGLETPSLNMVRGVGQVQVVDGEESSTSQARKTNGQSRRRKRRLTITGYKIKPGRVELARRMAVSLRPRVNWMQGASYAQLSWVLLDLVAQDWDEAQVYGWLERLGYELGLARRRPRHPHRLIAAALLRMDKAKREHAEQCGPDHEEAAAQAAPPNAAFAESVHQMRSRLAPPQDNGEYPPLSVCPQLPVDVAEMKGRASDDRSFLRYFLKWKGREETLLVCGGEHKDFIDQTLDLARVGRVEPGGGQGGWCRSCRVVMPDGTGFGLDLCEGCSLDPDGHVGDEAQACEGAGASDQEAGSGSFRADRDSPRQADTYAQGAALARAAMRSTVGPSVHRRQACSSAQVSVGVDR